MSRNQKEIIDKKFCFVHLDVDLYKSTIESLRFFFPKMVSGGIILIHDYHSDGIQKAIKEFKSDNQIHLIELTGSQAMIIKNYWQKYYFQNLFYFLLFDENPPDIFKNTNPIPTPNHLVKILIKTTIVAASEISIPCKERNPVNVPSVTPIPIGKNEIKPKSIELV